MLACDFYSAFAGIFIIFPSNDSIPASDYGHVLGFKGLERPVVVLAVNGIRDMSRSYKIAGEGLENYFPPFWRRIPFITARGKVIRSGGSV